MPGHRSLPSCAKCSFHEVNNRQGCFCCHLTLIALTPVIHLVWKMWSSRLMESICSQAAIMEPRGYGMSIITRQSAIFALDFFAISRTTSGQNITLRTIPPLAYNHLGFTCNVCLTEVVDSLLSQSHPPFNTAEHGA